MTSPPPALRAGPEWVVRALWLAQPLFVGPALGDALDARSAGVRILVTVVAWGLWTGTFVGLLVPRATSLTLVRVVAPGAVAAAAWAASTGTVTTAVGLVAVGWAALTAAGTWSSAVVDAFVDGSSYGSEKRFALRTPLPLAALSAATWTAVAAGVTVGPLLLAARQWAPGAVLTALGAGVAYVGVRSLHGLARRWLVLVPSGVVVHDPVSRPDSVMAPRPLVVRLGPAPADSDALDLTLGAPGLPLLLETSEPLPVTVRRPGRDLGTEPATRVLIAVGRPAAVLAEATQRRLPVG